VWAEAELSHGKLIKVFPKDKKVKLFRLVSLPTERMSVATNDSVEDSTDVVQQVCGIRWKIEEFHRELKQLTGVEACQCRKARLQRNHIGCAMLVWARDCLPSLPDYLPDQAWLLSNYLIQHLKILQL